MSRERAWVASTSSESFRVNICWLELCVRFLYTPLTYNNNWRTISIRPGAEDRHPKTHLKTIFSLHFIILFFCVFFFLNWALAATRKLIGNDAIKRIIKIGPHIMLAIFYYKTGPSLEKMNRNVIIFTWAWNCFHEILYVHNKRNQ